MSVPAKKPPLTPKAIIHQKFGSSACYNVEELQAPAENGCPGLAISHKGPSLYQCYLQLPEFSVMSGTFKKKKDAEQSAAQKALDRLGIQLREEDPTIEEAWNNLVSRLSYFFSDEFLSSNHPLSGHLRAVLQREGQLSGLVPISVISTYDSKIGTLCKFINPAVESNPLLVISLLLRAAASLPSSLSSSVEQLSLQRCLPYPSDILQSSVSKLCSSTENVGIKAILIPCTLEKNVEPSTLYVPVSGYYLDVIGQELGVPSASEVLASSRTIGKASSEMRVYYCVPKSYLLDPLSEQHAKEVDQTEESLNARASYLSGQVIRGDAILASVGYTWKSTNFYHEDVFLHTYYRLLINKIPSGIYKLSRGAIFAAQLPFAFMSRNSWRGSFPRDILCTFCRQHHLSEPVFSVSSSPLKSSPESLFSQNKLNVTEPGTEESNGSSLSVVDGKRVALMGNFRCEIKIFSKCEDLIIKCSPKESYKKESDAIQNTALRVLSWLNAYFSELDIPLERLSSSGVALDIEFYPCVFFREFKLCSSVHNSWKNLKSQRDSALNSNCMNLIDVWLEDGFYINIEGPRSGVTPSSGSLVSVSYSVSLVAEGKHVKELLESSDGFDFEMGVGAVLTQLETAVAQMNVGQSARFNMELPPRELILAAASDPERVISLLSLRGCFLEYIVTLIQVTEPLEDRMEQALFSPPLSKQRVEFAVKHIKEFCAVSLVDFGCGSGSLLDSLLEYSSSLEKVAGVDISQKGLTRAAKMLHSKLSSTSNTVMTKSKIKSALLYEGSITNYDSRLYGFDIATCLEVIEHMEEKEAWLFGDVVLSSFCPRVLIVSTPNYEYNVILQKSLHSKEDDPDDQNQPHARKFRNHDHKFEWTREQFYSWASDLSARHNYAVEFSGVGGDGDVEPGFASQIAVFRREKNCMNVESVQHYQVIWDWCNAESSTSAT